MGYDALDQVGLEADQHSHRDLLLTDQERLEALLRDFGLEPEVQVTDDGDDEEGLYHTAVGSRAKNGKLGGFWGDAIVFYFDRAGRFLRAAIEPDGGAF